MLAGIPYRPIKKATSTLRKKKIRNTLIPLLVLKEAVDDTPTFDIEFSDKVVTRENMKDFIREV